MGRPRKDGSKDLPPGLYIYKGRNPYIKMIESMKPVDLGNVTKDDALALYWEFRRHYDQAQAKTQATELAARIEAAAVEPTGTTVAGYAKHWRKTYLPTLLKKGGEPLDDSTRADYGRTCENQIEEYEPFQNLAIARCGSKELKQFLSQWIGSPSFYNSVLSVCSRIFQQADDEGLIDGNPAQGVTRRPTTKRKIKVPREDYLKITAQMDAWDARACDLVYLVSHNPVDVLALKDEPPAITHQVRRIKVDDKEVDVKCLVVSFARSKTDVPVEIIEPIGHEGGIADALEWFRAFKKEQGYMAAVKHFAVYRKKLQKRHVGKPISVGYLSKRFAAAVVKAGFTPGKYTLRDLRKTALTDEARIAGKATDKGGHKTEQMKEYYVVEQLPQRSRNNLSVLRAKS